MKAVSRGNATTSTTTSNTLGKRASYSSPSSSSACSDGRSDAPPLGPPAPELPPPEASRDSAPASSARLRASTPAKGESPWEWEGGVGEGGVEGHGGWGWGLRTVSQHCQRLPSGVEQCRYGFVARMLGQAGRGSAAQHNTCLPNSVLEQMEATGTEGCRSHEWHDVKPSVAGKSDRSKAHAPAVPCTLARSTHGHAAPRRQPVQQCCAPGDAATCHPCRRPVPRLLTPLGPIGEIGSPAAAAPAPGR